MSGFHVSLLLFLSGICLSASDCPIPWVEFEESCYLFNKERKTWLDAERYCRFNEGGYLGTIDSPEKTAFIDPILRTVLQTGNDHFWIGGSDFAVENQWRWIKSGKPIHYFNWGYTDHYGQEPTGGDSENCIMIQFLNHQYKWADDVCNAEHYFICEKITNYTLIAQPVG